MKNIRRIFPLLLAGLILAGCSSLVKPEINPVILTSTPPATNLRSARVPEGMLTYDSLEAMKQAWQEGDSNLGDLSAIPILKILPSDMKAAYSAKPDEVAVTYQDQLSSQRTIMINAYYGENPDSFLADFGEEDYYSPAAIDGEEFHLLTDHADDTNREAYTLKTDWFIHVFASGFSAEEFTELLGTLELTPLD